MLRVSSLLCVSTLLGWLPIPAAKPISSCPLAIFYLSAFVFPGLQSIAAQEKEAFAEDCEDLAKR